MQRANLPKLIGLISTILGRGRAPPRNSSIEANQTNGIFFRLLGSIQGILTNFVNQMAVAATLRTAMVNTGCRPDSTRRPRRTGGLAPYLSRRRDRRREVSPTEGDALVPRRSPSGRVSKAMFDGSRLLRVARMTPPPHGVDCSDQRFLLAACSQGEFADSATRWVAGPAGTVEHIEHSRRATRCSRLRVPPSR